MGVKNYRQGDVLMFGLPKLELQTRYGKDWRNKLKAKADNIIIEGETTGHMHEVINGKLYESPTNKDVMILEAQKGCKVIHPEHGPIDMPEGTYEIDIQREYINEQAKKVKD